MLRLLLLSLACAVLLVNSQMPSPGVCPTVKTQATLDINRYLGNWYEMFAFPTPYSRGNCTRASYALKPNGHIEVYNRGFQGDQEFSVVGDAFVADPNEPAKLKVRFSEGTPCGKYWVLNTDYDTYTLIYSCTTIGGLSHIEFAWILARNMTLDDQVSKSLINELASYNVDTSKFEPHDHTGCPP